ncbi:hypothetical protein B0J13DRAFT_26447 [Dactylonectria estremocensis]|uniref:Peptidase S54 rhomboid domain-containing protein n=1 Tax=Dactylonectria estremocensis TaxID=1079267 RepID=A0A9P9FIS6_9HYPO|nr:hypothetical protein B0J13DRAFT_26447 [Dactylonectria estremocensis]
MSLFVCPNSSRLWLKVALRGVSSRAAAITTNTNTNTTTTASTTHPFSPARWISTRHGLLSSSPSRRRNTVFAPNYPSVARRTLFSDKTVRHYEDLPSDYRDQVGLSFRSLDLTDSEVLKVFGRGINSKRANHLLRILHGRRVAGTLDDPVFAVHTAQFTKDQVAKALIYLRKSIPVNEVLNAGLRAEDELAQLEQDMDKTAVEKEKKKQTSAKTDTREEQSPAKSYVPDPVYGHSKLDEMRSQNVAKRKAKEKAEDEERRAAEARGEVAGPLAQAGGKQERQIQNPKIAEYHKNAESDLEAPPEMKPWERILPSATVVGLVIGLLASLAAIYEEPEARYRIFPDISTAHATVGAIIALNVLAYAAWAAPPMWKFCNRYMIFVVATVKPLTLFTATFSHQKAAHLFFNMVPLWFMGSLLHDEIGRANFLALYLGCGALGFLGGLTMYTLRGWMHISSLGASGANLGVCSAYFWDHRTDGFKIFGLPQDGVHGIVFLALLFVPQLSYIGRTAKVQIDLVSHVVGMLAGIVGIEYIHRGEPERQKKVFEFGSPNKGNAIGTLDEGATNDAN